MYFNVYFLYTLNKSSIFVAEKVAPTSIIIGDIKENS